MSSPSRSGRSGIGNLSRRRAAGSLTIAHQLAGDADAFRTRLVQDDDDALLGKTEHLRGALGQVLNELPLLAEVGDNRTFDRDHGHDQLPSADDSLPSLYDLDRRACSSGAAPRNRRHLTGNTSPLVSTGMSRGTMPPACSQHQPRVVFPGCRARRHRDAMDRPPKLLDQMRDTLRARHYSLHTEQAYLLWARRFIYFHRLRHPTDMGQPEINAFLTHLAVQENVSASTQNQALAALLFLYRHVLAREIGDLEGVVRARRSLAVPIVMTRAEVQAVLAQLTGDKRLIASVLYGSGLRLMQRPARPVICDTCPIRHSRWLEEAAFRRAA
jgi:hypothetical protein